MRRSATLMATALAAAAVAAPAKAQGRLGVVLNAGASQVRGDLTEKAVERSGAGGLSMLIYMPSPGGGVAGLIDFDLGTRSVYHDAGDDFPFEPGKKVGVSTAAVSFVPCFFADAPVSLCPGVGYSQIEVEQKDGYRQTYGGTMFGVYVGRIIASGVLAYLRVDGVGVTQEVDRKESGFTVINATAGLGWAFAFEQD